MNGPGPGRPWANRVGFALFAMALALAPGCADDPDVAEPSPIEFELLDSAPGTMKQVAWIDDDSYVIQTYDLTIEVGALLTSSLWLVRGGSPPEKLEPVPLSRCGKDGVYAHESPIRLEPGVLGYVQRCARRTSEGTPSLGHLGFLLAYDLSTHERVDEVRGTRVQPLLGDILDSEVDGIAVDLTSSTATVTRSVGASSLRTIDLEVGRTVATPSVPFSQVWGLSASPDQKRIAFVARKGSTGPPGQVHAGLFTSDPTFREATEIVANIEGLFGTGWSFDGKWIVFGGTVGGVLGMYVVKPDGTQLQLIARGAFQPTGSSWSPSGYRIAVVDKSDPSAFRIKMFDLAAVLPVD